MTKSDGTTTADGGVGPPPTIGNRASLIRFAAWAVATDRSGELAGDGRINHPDGVPHTLGMRPSTFRRRIRDDIRYVTVAPGREPHPIIPEATLDAILGLVRRIEAARRTDTLEPLTRRFLGPSDDQLVTTVGASWWPRLRRLDTWRDPADVLIAAEAAINYLRERGDDLDAADDVGLSNLMEMLAVVLAGGHGSMDQAVARTAVLVWQLWLHGSEGRRPLVAFIEAIGRLPGNNLALRALDRAVRSHQGDPGLVAFVAEFFDQIVDAGPPLDAWLPGSYLTRLVRVLGQYGDTEAQLRSIDRLGAHTVDRASTFTNRRACAWALLETVGTGAGWQRWEETARALAAEDAERAVPEFNAILALAPPSSAQDEIHGRLVEAGARRTDRALLDLVNARVAYEITPPDLPPEAGPVWSSSPSKGDMVIHAGPTIAAILAEAIPSDDEKLRRVVGWRAQTSTTRSAARALLIETLLTPSVIRADTAVETLLAAGPAVRAGCENALGKIFTALFRGPARPVPQWFLERTLSLTGFFRLAVVLGELATMAADPDRDPYLRARAALVVGDVLHARSDERTSLPRRAEADVDDAWITAVAHASVVMRRLIDREDVPVPVRIASARTLGLLGWEADHPLLLDVAKRADDPSVARMARWAAETIANPFR